MPARSACRSIGRRVAEALAHDCSGIVRLDSIRQSGCFVYLINEKSRTLQTIEDEDEVALGGNLFCTPPDKGRDLVLRLSGGN